MLSTRKENDKVYGSPGPEGIKKVKPFGWRI